MSRVVLHSGTVITCSTAGQVCEAICFDEADRRIVAVGANADMRAAASEGARVIDLGGATVLPASSTRTRT